jgi:hypothetical protein
MSAKDDFSETEWSALLRAPGLVGLAVVAAAPSGPLGVFRELAAFGRAVAETAQAAPHDSLLGAVVADLKAIAERRVDPPPEERVPPGETEQHALDACRVAMDALRARATPDETAAYRDWLLAVGERVAAAAREGGFLGFGGVAVSPEETRVLRRLAWTLGAPVEG